MPLADLTAELADSPLSALDGQGDDLVQRAMTADYEGLDPLGRELLRLIGVQPVSRFSFPMLLALISPAQEPRATAEDTAGADDGRQEANDRARRVDRVRRVLDDLVTAHLLTHHPVENPSPAIGTADQSDATGPVWEIDAAQHHFARHLAETLDPAEVRLAAVVRVVDLVLWPALHAADLAVTPYRRRTSYPDAPDYGLAGAPVFADRTAALVWLERNVDTIAAYARALHAAGEHQRSWHLIDALWPLWLHRKHYTLRLELDTLALRAAGAWGDEAAQAEMFKRLGLVENSLRSYEAAREALTAALALRLKLRDRWGESDCRIALGLHYRAVGDTDRASTQFRLAATGYQAVGALREQALTNHNLGTLYLDQGQYHLAQVQLSRTLDEFAALDEPDEYNALRAQVDLARAHVGLRQYRQARDLAVEAGNGLARLGNVVEHARALEVLADIAHVTDDPSYRHRLTEALTLYESVGSPHADRLRERLAATSDSATNHSAGGVKDERP